MHALDLAIIRGRLQQVADEMDLVHTRAAFSPVISEMADRANSIIDPQRLEVVTQGKTGLPVFVTTMQSAARAIMDTVGHELRDGDVIVMNDPYACGTHLQDVKMLRPWFADGKIALLLVNTGHYVDIGSAAAGGFDPAATDIHQEGLFLPPSYVMRGGHICEDMLRLFLANTRLPEAVEGDFRAQLNALEVGARRLDALVEERGIGTLREAVDELGTRSEEQMRTYLRLIPNGTYRAHDVVEISPTEELAVELSITFKDGAVTADFTGSSPAYLGPFNISAATTETSVFLAFKHLFPEVPINGGCVRPFSFVIPDGCFLGAQRPSAVGGYPETSQRVLEAVWGAIAEALPDLAWGGTFGTGGTLTMTGRNTEGAFFAAVFPACGGLGGSKSGDGLAHSATPIGLAKFPKLEASEHDYPVLWEAMEIVPDSAGQGSWRGGPGTRFRVRALVPMHASFLADRARHGARGILGGESSGMTSIVMNTASGAVGGKGTAIVPRTALRPGDTVEFVTPGGGGYGPRALRDKRLIEADLADGIVTQ